MAGVGIMGRSERWPNGSTPAWRRVRLFVLRRDNYQCQLRHEHCTFSADDVHHTRDRLIVGDDPAYLVASCAWCNKHEGDPTKRDPVVTRHRWW